MPKFMDSAGRQWDVHVNVSSIKRVKSATSIDLFGVLEKKGELFIRLASDAALLVDVLFEIVRPQAEQQGISADSFGEAMAGDSIAHATEALLGSIADFSQHPEERAALHRVLKVMADRRAKEMRTAMSNVTEEKLHQAIDAALASSSNGSATTPDTSA